MPSSAPIPTQTLQLPEKFQCFCSNPPGLELATVRELESMGIQGHATQEGGGVYCTVSRAQLPLLTQLHTPTAIRWQLINGQAIRALSDLHRKLEKIPWLAYFPKHAQLQLQVSCKNSMLQRSDIVEDKANRFLRTMFTGEHDQAYVILPLIIRIKDDKLWVSVELHRELLHRRGWREHNVKTPIRENWASCLLDLAGWSPSMPLVDPFAGSGTITIEAMRRAHGLGPHLNSATWLFAEWGWEEVALAVSAIVKPKLPTDAPIMAWGFDRDENSIHKAEQNARLAQVGQTIAFRISDVRDMRREMVTHGKGVIVANPPYGKQSGKKTDAVYHWLGAMWRSQFPDWSMVFVATDRYKAHLVDPAVQFVCKFSNAGMDVGVYRLHGKMENGK